MPPARTDGRFQRRYATVREPSRSPARNRSLNSTRRVCQQPVPPRPQPREKGEEDILPGAMSDSTAGRWRRSAVKAFEHQPAPSSK